MHSLDRQHPLYVEFVGFPGAGKTTVCHELVPLLMARQYRCVVRGNGIGEPQYGFSKRKSHRRRGRFEKALFYLSLHVSMWRLAASAYRYVLAEGAVTKNRIRASRSLLKGLYGMLEPCQLVREGKADLLLYSQGFVATLRELAGGDVTTADAGLAQVASALRTVIPQVRVALVVFDLDPEAAVARIQRRPQMLGPYDRMPSADAVKELGSQQPYLAKIITGLRRADAVHAVLHIDATKAPAENARLIADYVVEQLPVPRSADPIRPASLSLS